MFDYELGYTNKLLSLRESRVEESLTLGRMALTLLDEYEELSLKASEDNILAMYLPGFTKCLLDQKGSFGLLEYALKNELKD